MDATAIIAIIDLFIGAGIILLELFALLLIAGFFVTPPRFRAFVRTNAMTVAFVLSLGAALGTLYYSEVVGILPCTLCWYQRALLYPQVLLFAYGVARKNAKVLPFTALLSALGLLTAVYHISLPLFTSPIFCDPETALCLVQSVRVFGYITIPVMSASIFAVLILLSIIGLRARHAPHEQVKSL
ncbi:MAG TPA: disulfide bond formation protein B [Candidatus Paceibacterota bacterium]|nr:disulfide bond formation protein B [Candidatus Paceibacterota bacterium]